MLLPSFIETIRSFPKKLIFALLAETRARLDAQRTANQDQIDVLGAQIETLEAELLPLPGPAKALRAQGFVRQSKELVDQIEELNINIARLKVEQARLEADRLAGFHGAFRAIFPQVNFLVTESIKEGKSEDRKLSRKGLLP